LDFLGGGSLGSAGGAGGGSWKMASAGGESKAERTEDTWLEEMAGSDASDVSCDRISAAYGSGTPAIETVMNRVIEGPSPTW